MMQLISSSRSKQISLLWYLTPVLLHGIFVNMPSGSAFLTESWLAKVAITLLTIVGGWIMACSWLMSVVNGNPPSTISSSRWYINVKLSRMVRCVTHKTHTPNSTEGEKAREDREIGGGGRTNTNPANVR